MISPPGGATLRSVLRRALLVTLILSLVMGAAGVGAVTLITERVDTLSSTLQPLASANAAVLEDLTNAETGLRGYELTRQTSYLQPYDSGRAAYPHDLATAQALARRGTTRRLLDAEANDGRTWLRDFAIPVLAGTSSRALDARGKQLLDRFRAANAAVGTNIHQRIEQTKGTAHRDERWARIVLVVLFVLTVVVGTVVGLGLLRRVAPPLERITAALLRMAGGDDSVSVPDEGTAELRQLGGAANFLAEQNLANRRRDRLRERLSILSRDITRKLSEHLDLEVVLGSAADTFGSAFDVDYALLRLADGGQLGPVVAEWHAPGLESIALAPSPPQLNTFLDRLAARHLCFAVEDLDAAEEAAGRHPAIDEYLTRIGVKAVLLCPLEAGGTLVGGLGLLQMRSPRAWLPEEVASVQDLAGDLGRALSNAKLYGDQRRVVEELEQLDRAKTEFISTVSHELRTPLTSVSGYVEMLRDGEGGELPESAAEMLGIVEYNSNRLRHLVEDLLTLSRVNAGVLVSRRQPVDLGQLVATAAAAVGAQAHQGGVRLTVGPLPMAAISGDPEQLERVVLNLLSNGVKFTPPGGAVTVKVIVTDSEVLLRVSDEGIGIPEEELERIGTRFFRASNTATRAVPGTGLGLSIVGALVEQHGGRLDIASRLGEGSVFTVILPRVAAEEADQPGDRRSGSVR